MANFNLEIEIDEIPEPYLDDDHIAVWVEARLNDASNVFIGNVGAGVGAGRRYYRRGRVHQASLPGAYPASDSGDLLEALQPVEMLSNREGRLAWGVPYARYLTTGTATMRARKMLNAAIRDVIDNRPASDRLAQAAKVE